MRFSITKLSYKSFERNGQRCKIRVSIRIFRDTKKSRRSEIHVLTVVSFHTVMSCEEKERT